MKIDDVTLTIFTWDNIPATRYTSGSQTAGGAGNLGLLRIHTDQGLEGHAFLGSATNPASMDAPQLIRTLKPLLLGQDPLERERLHQAMKLQSRNVSYRTIGAADVALWDLAGKITGQPCWKLLGGLSNKVRAYVSSGTLRDPGGMAELAERYVAEGFSAMKIRFQRGDWRDDIRALEAVRARIGDRLELMVDCNQGWRLPQDTYAPWSLKDAIRVGRELERLGVYWMEEPLHRGDREGMRRLRGMVDMRVAGGEMTRELYEFRDLITEGCLDVLQPDAALVGGITGLRRVALMAQEHNLVFTPHTWGNGMGLVANIHLTAGLCDAPFIEFPYDPPDWSYDRRDYMMTEPCAPDADGWLRLSDAPGMGYAPDEAMLARTRIG